MVEKTQLLAIDSDVHAALKVMSANPNEKRSMKKIVQESLVKNDPEFTKTLVAVRGIKNKTGGPGFNKLFGKVTKYFKMPGVE